MHQQWVPTSFNAVCVYPLRIVENGSTLTTEMGPLSYPVSIAPWPSLAAQLRSIPTLVNPSKRWERPGIGPQSGTPYPPCEPTT